MLFAATKPNSSGSDLDECNSNILPEDASSESIQLSLLELKRKQEEILRALENESSDSNSTPLDHPVDETPGNIDKENNATNDTDKKISDESASNEANQNDKPNENDADVSGVLQTASTENDEMIENKSNLLGNVPNTPSPSVAGQSRLAMCGTPLIKQVSPYSKLPTGTKWSVGVSDVIDFENLPDATGTYSKLTGVINKVRNVIKRINDEEHDDHAS